MTAVWIGLGLAGWFVLAGVVGVLIGRGITTVVTLETDDEPEWGCDCCQDEAEEIAVLEAWWAAS